MFLLLSYFCVDMWIITFSCYLIPHFCAYSIIFNVFIHTSGCNSIFLTCFTSPPSSVSSHHLSVLFTYQMALSHAVTHSINSCCTAKLINSFAYEIDKTLSFVWRFFCWIIECDRVSLFFISDVICGALLRIRTSGQRKLILFGSLLFQLLLIHSDLHMHVHTHKYF